MTKLKSLLPEDKYLRRTVILFAIGMIVRLIVFILGDISAASSPDNNEHSEKMLGGFATALAVGNPILIVGMILAFSGIDKLTGITVPAIPGLIVIQLLNLGLDFLFLRGVCRLEKRPERKRSLPAMCYTVIYLAGAVPGLVFYQIPFNIMTIIAMIIFYIYNVPKKEKTGNNEEKEEGLSE